jgi:spore maturation protein CgeB
MSYLKNEQILNRLNEIKSEKKKLLNNIEALEKFQEQSDINENNDGIYEQINKLEEEVEFYKDDIVTLTKKIIEANNIIYSNNQNNSMLCKKSSVIKDVNLDEYQEKKVTSFTFNKNDWFTNSEHIKLESNILESKIEEGYAYVSYLEQNVNFGKLPEKAFMKIDSDNNYFFELNGEKSPEVEIQLFIISYSEKEKLYVDSIELNNFTNIIFDENVKKLRLAIKVSGKGIVRIDRINIVTKKNLQFMNYNQLINMGFLKRDELKELKIGCIFDEFTMGCFGPEAKLITFEPYNWKARFSITRPDVLIVESAWVGNFGIWKRKISVKNKKDLRDLKELVNWCKDNNIPTLFWNKEDPVHFNAFIEAASLFDFIFTTDENSIPKYIERVNHNRVYPMPFAAQPEIHNPTKIVNNRIAKACFAGSYYAKKYEERKNDISRLFDVFENYGLDIYDRNYGEQNEDFKFPEKYQKDIKGKLVGEEIQKAYKGYRFMININSVKDSPTMFSRRVFEGLASNTPVISSYSLGMNRIFKDIVIATDDEVELSKKVQKLINDVEKYKRICLLGLREVMEKHTYKERLKYMLAKADFEFNDNISSVTVVALVKDEEEIKRIVKYYKQQAITFKELAIFTEKQGVINNTFQYEDLIIPIFPLDSFDQVIKTSYFSVFSPNNYYAPNFLRDLLTAVEYADADVIGKTSYYDLKNNSLTLINEDEEYVYSDKVVFNAAITNKNVLRFIDDKRTLFYEENSGFVSMLSKFGVRFYGTDKYNFVKNYFEQQVTNLDEVII